MKFAKIMELVGMGNLARIFTEAAEVDVFVYDGKDRIYEDDNIKFIEELFADNKESYKKFFDFVDRLNCDPVMSMDVKIDKDYVTVFYNTPASVSFRRKETLGSFD